jgi:hypothetical protein
LDVKEPLEVLSCTVSFLAPAEELRPLVLISKDLVEALAWPRPEVVEGKAVEDSWSIVHDGDGPLDETLLLPDSQILRDRGSGDASLLCTSEESFSADLPTVQGQVVQQDLPLLLPPQ